MGSGRPKVVIVGAGFGGLNAARRLGNAPLDVLVVDRHNYHLFQPLLYQVATAGLEPGEIAYPVRRILHRFPNIEFRLANVEAVDVGRRCLRLEGEQEIPYDYLILAAGSDTNFFGMDQLARHSHTLKDVAGAVRLRNHVLERLELAMAEHDPAKRRSMLTFVIGGGGPTGVEYAGALSELLSMVPRRVYRTIATGEIRIHLIEGGPDLLGAMHPSLRRSALRELQRRNVRVTCNTEITSYDGHTVELSSGPGIAADTLLWAAGIRAADIGGRSGIQPARGGRLPIKQTLEPADHPEIYVVGDLAFLEERGKPLPQVAPVAIQQGQLAAENLLRRLAGQQARPFRYRDKGSLATIGRQAAVGELGPIRVTGPVAWVMWLGVHLIQLIGFRNRAVVLLDWAWSYFRFDSAVPLITDA